jgi:hypothetical protein
MVVLWLPLDVVSDCAKASSSDGRLDGVGRKSKIDAAILGSLLTFRSRNGSRVKTSSMIRRQGMLKTNVKEKASLLS